MKFLCEIHNKFTFKCEQQCYLQKNVRNNTEIAFKSSLFLVSVKAPRIMPKLVLNLLVITNQSTYYF